MTDTGHSARVRQAILDAGLVLWRAGGAGAVTQRSVARQAGMTHGNVRHHCGSSEDMRDAVAREAVRVADAVVVPQLIACRHVAVADMAADVRAAYLSGC